MSDETKRIPSPNLDIKLPDPRECWAGGPVIDQALADIQRIHKLVEEAEASNLRPLHRLIRVPLAEIEGMVEPRVDDLLNARPVLCAVRDNGDIVLWPKPLDGGTVNLYVE